MSGKGQTTWLIALGVLLACLAGCATPGDLTATRAGILAQLAQNRKQQDEQLALIEARVAKLETMGKLLEERTATEDREVKRLDGEVRRLAKLPEDLESEVAALRTYVRDVEKNITTLRELVARQLDVQNAHIAKIKAAYDDVLKDHGAMVAGLTKTLDEALARLKTTIEDSLKKLREKIPTAEETIPLAPQLPTELKKGGGAAPKAKP